LSNLQEHNEPIDQGQQGEQEQGRCMGGAMAADLQAVIGAWENIPPQGQAAILAIVQAYAKQPQG